jgi:hypothetical protein
LTRDEANSHCEHAEATPDANPHTVDAAADADTRAGAGADTPVFHATVRALAAAQPGTNTPTESIVGGTAAGAAPLAGHPERSSPQHVQDELEDWIEQQYGDPPTSSPVLDPDSPEGAAILSLFGRIKDIEGRESDWPGADVVDVLTAWFTEMGINPDEDRMINGRRLRLALREHPGCGLASSVYGVRINTEHDEPEALIRTALHVLARQLGPACSIELVSHDRALLARIETRPGTPANPTISS